MTLDAHEIAYYAVRGTDRTLDDVADVEKMIADHAKNRLNTEALVQDIKIVMKQSGINQSDIDKFVNNWKIKYE
jgi:hypothetical protein